MGVDGYCTDVNSTLTQTYRFRPFMNKHGRGLRQKLTSGAYIRSRFSST